MSTGGIVNVRYSRGDNTDGGETEVEIQVEISENEDTLNDRQTDRGSHEVRPLGRTSCLSAVFRSRLTPVRAVAALCLLMMAGIFTRYILATLDKQTLMAERDQLNINLNQAQTSLDSLAVEIQRLQTRYNILTTLFSQSERKQAELEAQIAGCSNPPL